MPAHRTSMLKLKEVLRLKWACGLSRRQISRAVGISVGAISEYAAQASAAGLDWTSVEPLDDDELERRLSGRSAPAPTRRVVPDYAWIHRELRRKGVTLQLLWEEYVQAHPNERTYRYTQFCRLYKEWAKTLKRSMRQQHRAGEKLFADFAGHTVSIAAFNGDVAFQAHVFVAVLGASNYTFACATRSETMVDWISSLVDAMAFFGGVPELLVLDFVAGNKIEVLCPSPLCGEMRELSSLEAVDRECVSTSLLPSGLLLSTFLPRFPSAPFALTQVSTT